MCDTSAILDLNSLGIMHLRDGRNQEAMNNFEASLAQLMTYVQKNDLFDRDGSENLCPTKKRRRNTSDNLAGQSGSSRKPTTPFAMSIPFKDSDICSQAESLFNQVLVLPQNETITQENCDVIYASLLYNMALVLHNHGLQNACEKALLRALETYELAHEVLLRDLNPPSDKYNAAEKVASKKCVQHWLMYATFNNMASVYSYACAPTMTNYCLERLRCVLTYSDSSLLTKEDLLFYVVNLDVLGCPHIAAGAA